MCKNRGSEWRRWDLHIHTPNTKKEDKFSGKTYEERWENYYKDIQNYNESKENQYKIVSAIGITDYLSIDNYKKVIKDKKLPSSIKLVLPNIEMRISFMAQKSPVNIHFIFDPDIVDSLEDIFFSRLVIQKGDEEYQATKMGITKFGHDYEKSYGRRVNDEQAYKIGIDQFVPDFTSIQNIFKKSKELRIKTIIGVSNKERDGVSGICKNENISQLDATKNIIYQNVDLIFSSNKKDIKYFLGEGPDSEDIVKKKCGSLKPCVHGCDAHENNKIFEPDLERYCWIKSDVTFEGLKQILYEPKQRVYIGPNFPEKKPDYHVIDYIEIDNDNFGKTNIFLNDKLNCIIGGKSTGKSLLLHNIALAVDKNQVEEKNKISPTNISTVQNFKIHWKDSSDSIKKIVYIPQTYLNKLCDKKEQTTEIDTIIESIILKDENTKEKFDELKNNISSYKDDINKGILDIINYSRKLNEINEQITEIGNEDGLSKEILKLKNEIINYNINTCSSEDFEEFEKIREGILKCQNKIKEINENKNKLNLFNAITTINSEIKDYKFIPEIHHRVDVGIREIINESNKMWNRLKTNISEELSIIDNKLKEDMESLNERYLLLVGKVETNNNIKLINEMIRQESDKLQRLKNLKTSYEEIYNTYNRIVSSICESNNKYFNFYQEFCSFVNSKQQIRNNLGFKVEVVFRSNDFIEYLKQSLNNKTFNKVADFDVNNFKNHNNIDNLEILIRSLFKNDSNNIQPKNGKSVENVIRDITSDWFNLNYIVEMDNDEIAKMSPGKKSLVLLKLLLELSESNWPILIDQPEDDLDNRSIYKDLIQFIKSKKIERQIILATHNANIVLGGDAELIIVANQDGKDTPNKKFKFEYRTGAIENNIESLNEKSILHRNSIKFHICEILEGGKQAFNLRRKKYHLKRE